MSKDIEHTPLPWSISYGFSRLGGATSLYVAGANPESIGVKLTTPWIEGAWDGDAEANANAEFIVRACNSHYELCEALKECATAAENCFRQHYGDNPEGGYPEYLQRAFMALSRAREPASVDGRRMAETALAGSGRSPTSAVGEAETPNPSEEQPQ